jgi:hypothetical protein
MLSKLLSPISRFTLYVSYPIRLPKMDSRFRGNDTVQASFSVMPAQAGIQACAARGKGKRNLR